MQASTTTHQMGATHVRISGKKQVISRKAIAISVETQIAKSAFRSSGNSSVQLGAKNRLHLIRVVARSCQKALSASCVIENLWWNKWSRAPSQTSKLTTLSCLQHWPSKRAGIKGFKRWRTSTRSTVARLSTKLIQWTRRSASLRKMWRRWRRVRKILSTRFKVPRPKSNLSKTIWKPWRNT